MGFFDQFRDMGTPGNRPPGNQITSSTAPIDPWEQQMLATLEQRYGKGNPLVEQEFNYYKQKRASDEVSGRAGAGREFANMDAYWLHRATGTDPQDQPGGGGQSLATMGGGPGFGGGLPAGYLNTPAGISVSMPRPEELGSSPAYQWASGRAQDAINKSHAFRGTILGGGAAKDAAEFAAGAASSEYDKELGRRLGVAGFNRDSLWGDSDRIFNRNFSLADLGAGAASSYANNVSSLFNQGGAYNAINRGGNQSATGQLIGSGVDSLADIFMKRYLK